MESFDILVIVLSVTLAVFLTTAIVATVLFIKLLKKISLATDSAKQAVENVEAMTGTLKNVANGSVIAGIVGSLFEKMKSKSAKK